MTERRSRTYHLGRAGYNMCVFVAGFMGLLYVVSTHLEHSVNIAIVGMAFGLWFKEYFLNYAKHAAGVLSPGMAYNIGEQ